MIRALSSLCLLAVLVIGSSSAQAQKKKEKIAILGLEVVSQGAQGIDADSTRVAQELTVALRIRPRAGQGPFVFTPNSEKELIDEKLMNNCDSEARDCMAKIGEKLGADQLMYGRIERKSQGGSAGYQISLRLLKVANQAFTSWTEFIPIGETNGTKLADWGRKGYRKLTNENDGGTLVIVAKNFDRGTILVDGEERGNINSGRGEVQGLGEGRYKVSVVSTGFHRWDSDDKLGIRIGETTTEEVVLREMKPGDPPLCDPRVSECTGAPSEEPKTGFWKGLMVGGLVLAAGGGGLWAVSALQVDKAEKDLIGLDPSTEEAKDLTAKGESASTRTYVGGAILGVGVTVAVIGLIKGYVATGSGEKPAAGSTMGRSRKRPSGFAVTPVLSPQGAGATLRFDW
jgi:hypothetical protein